MGGATGHYIAEVLFHNTSAVACTLVGYPGFSLLDRKGRVLDVVRQRGGGFAGFPTRGPRVVLRPAGEANFRVEGLDFDAMADRPCPTSVTALIYAPTDTQQLRASLALPACGRGITISPVEPPGVYPTS